MTTSIISRGCAVANDTRTTVSSLVLYPTAALSVGVALIHLWVSPEHLESRWVYGLFALLVAFAQVLYGLALLRRPARRTFLLGAGGNLALVALYVATRAAEVPVLGPHAWRPETLGVLDLTAAVAELGLAVALVVLAGELARARLYLALGSLQALGAGLAADLLPRMHETHDLGTVLPWLRDTALSVPLSVLALLISTPLSRRIVASLYGSEAGRLSSGLAWALSVAVLYAAATGRGTAQHEGFASPLAYAGQTAGATLLVLLAVAALRGAPWEEPRALGLWRPRALTAVAETAVGVAILAGPAIFGGAFSSSAEAQTAPAACNAASYDRSYDVAAVNMVIPFNRWGDANQSGQVFVLQGDKVAMKNWSKPLSVNPQDDPAQNRRLRPRPLVIRANVGECVKVTLTNELNDRQWGGRLVNPRVGMQIRGAAYDAQTSDGSAVGFNEDTTIPNTPGQNRITYFWKAPQEEGVYMFRDQGATAGEQEDAGSIAHGLFGALAVEPAGSTWTDPETGQPVYAGVKDHDRITKESGDPYIDADINPPGGKSFRESVQLAQDYPAGIEGAAFAFNYGTEPQRNREEKLCPDCIGEETSLSSWVYGDPALVKLASGPGPWLPETDPQTGERVSREDCGLEGSCYVQNVSRAYPNDPTKIRFANVGSEEHVFHLHANQWKAELNDPGSNTIDSQTFGPGEGFNADLIGGAGSTPGTVGDQIFHCHLYPHFADGFWGLLRVYDVREDGTNKTPDGVNVRNLEPLKDRAAQAPPRATPENPGFPRFIPGEYGWRAPQAPDSIMEPNTDTPDPDDKRPAERIVAGEAIPAAKLAVERGVQELNYGKDANGDQIAPKPGAPLTDPCPTGAREVTYNVSLIQREIVYNEAGWRDTQGRILVLDKDVDRYLARNPDGTYKHQPEPLFVRVNAGDCINFNLTNRTPNWFGGDAFVKLQQTNMAGQHIHLVKFDVLGSDGSSNGWNYQQAAFTEEQMNFNREVLASTKPCSETDGCRIPMRSDWNPEWAGQEVGQTIRERWYADKELKTVFTHDHHFAAVDQNRGQFGGLIVEPKGTNFRNPKTGKFYQPGSGNVPGAPNCGASCEGNAVGSAMDVIGPNPGDDFREFGLAFQDYVSLTRAGGDPRLREDTFVPPAAPQAFPDEDPGIVGVNYRNAPFKLRQEKNGRPTDPAHVFSSTVHGDPATPVLEAYSEDPVQVRLLQGSQEHQHVFSLNGTRWRQEPDDPDSPLTSTQPIGISEAFNFKVPKLQCGAGDDDCAGDYLYSSTSVDDLYMGMWGILRARGKTVPSLLPLPDNASPNGATVPNAPTTTVPQNEGAPASGSGGAPPEANVPGNPCPTGAPVKKFNVVAMEAKIQYNRYGDNDPYGLIYALAEDEAAIRSGEKEPEPLVLRANEGDCLEVRLFNKLTPRFLDHKGAADGDAQPPLEPVTGTRAGLRVSLNPQLVRYDVRGSDGTAVGYNRDQTVAPGDNRLYRWYADDPGKGELGATNLTDFGDVRGHRHHGLFAGLNIEPRGATYNDPVTGGQVNSGVSADVRVPGANNDFREFTTFFQDGLNLRDKTGAIIEDPVDPAPEPGASPEPTGTAADYIDQGEKAMGYSNAPFRHRLGMEPEMATEANPIDGQALARVFSSKDYGDPDTPIFRAYAGDRVRMRVLQGADKTRQHSFGLAGHAWKAQPEDPNSNLISAQGGFSVGRALNVHLSGAGNGFAGDYRYADGMYRHHLSAGMWGMMRVYPQPPAAAALNPTPIGATDDPRAGGHPILPLEVAAANTTASLAASPAIVNFGGKTTLSGKLSGAGGPLANRPVVIEQRPAGAAAFTALPNGRLTTDANGAFSLPNVAPQKNTEYRVRFAGAPGAGLAATQAIAPVKVKALVSANVAKPLFKLGGAQRISGAVSPAHAGKVKLTIKRGAKVVAAKNATLRGSRYALNYKPPAPGTYSVVASFAGDADHLGGASAPRTFKVAR
ncbi:hypothetical protein [Rubrobacter xylanophilus]|uniref:hypothetical protein n=1 Tax=Rubrobacter xylanophilus TaxID=49319 RepID=UPI001C63C115|nr:hypothetical protein [Rubrobacter xylanophilus]